MNEEKKLTDEEIVKALEICSDVMSTNYDASKCKKCPYFLKKIDCVERSEKDWLDLIHRLQDENERLTKERNEYKGLYETMYRKWSDLCDKEFNCDALRKEKNEYFDKAVELQKQVDELKEERQTLVDKYNKADEAVDYWCEKYKQAVKDTAKEILKWLLGKAYVNKCIDLHINEVKVKFRENYGVEVE